MAKKLPKVILEADGTRRIITDNWEMALIPKDWDLSDKPNLPIIPDVPKYILVYQDSKILKEFRIQYEKKDITMTWVYDEGTEKTSEIFWKFAGCTDIFEMMNNSDILKFLNSGAAIMDEYYEKHKDVLEE